MLIPDLYSKRSLFDLLRMLIHDDCYREAHLTYFLDLSFLCPSLHLCLALGLGFRKLFTQITILGSRHLHINNPFKRGRVTAKAMPSFCILCLAFIAKAEEAANHWLRSRTEWKQNDDFGCVYFQSPKLCNKETKKWKECFKLKNSFDS